MFDFGIEQIELVVLKYTILEFKIIEFWNLQFRFWNLEYRYEIGIVNLYWDSGFGIWNDDLMETAIRNLQCGVWYLDLEHGI